VCRRLLAWFHTEHELSAALLVSCATFQSTEVATSALKSQIPASRNPDVLQGFDDEGAGADDAVDRSGNFRAIPRRFALYLCGVPPSRVQLVGSRSAQAMGWPSFVAGRATLLDGALVLVIFSA
jgi:hypothetical protein